MKRVYFDVDWFESDQEFVESISSQTPSETPIWNDIRAVTDPSDADYHIAFNQPTVEIPHAELHIFCMEPPCIPGKCENWDQYPEAKTYPLSEFHKPQRWKVGKSYSDLKEMDPPEKRRDLSWITTDKGRELHPVVERLRKVVIDLGYRKYEKKPVPFLNRLTNSHNFPTDGHILRMQFLDNLVGSEPKLLDLYGRGDFEGPHYHGEIDVKWTGLENYRYSLAIENYKGENYFSEKIIDPLLAWSMPIYWGCMNLDEYLPEDSYVWIDIEDPNAPQRVRKVVESDRREKNIDAIAEARRRILDEYQIWPTVERCVD